MPTPGAELERVGRWEADLAVCRRLLADGSKSFHAASLLLPGRIRGPVAAMYAFCRVADDAIDTAPPGTVHRALDRLHARLERIYAGAPEDDPVDRAFAVVVHQAGIPAAVPMALLEGFLWDAEGRFYEDLSGVLEYAARVASTVGVMMTLLMGERDPATLARACDLGLAMQLSNIARDVGEDARNSRIYLPISWLRQAGVDSEELVARPVHTEALGQVVERLLREADVLYARADLGVPRLPADCRTSIRAARLIYSDLGRVIRRRGLDSVSGRARVSSARKLWLIGRSLAARLARPVGDGGPPADEVRFLVEAAGAV
jgi:phytoene synthase